VEVLLEVQACPCHALLKALHSDKKRAAAGLSFRLGFNGWKEFSTSRNIKNLTSYQCKKDKDRKRSIIIQSSLY
jgi:hypothetical protein